MAFHSTKENPPFLLLSISSWTVNSMDPSPLVSFLILFWGLDLIIIIWYLGYFKTLLPICLHRCLPLWEYLFLNIHLLIPFLILKTFSSCPLPAGRNPNFLQRHRPGFTASTVILPSSHATFQTSGVLCVHFPKPTHFPGPLLWHSLLLPSGMLIQQKSPLPLPPTQPSELKLGVTSFRDVIFMDRFLHLKLPWFYLMLLMHWVLMICVSTWLSTWLLSWRHTDYRTQWLAYKVSIKLVE